MGQRTCTEKSQIFRSLNTIVTREVHLAELSTIEILIITRIIVVCLPERGYLPLALKFDLFNCQLQIYR